MRVCHVTAPGTAGGLETVVRTLAAAFAARGHDVTVAASVIGPPDAHPFVESLRTAGVSVVPIPIRGHSWMAEIRTLADLAGTGSPDILHTHGFRSDVLGLLAARRRPTPLVSTVHGLTGGGWKVRLYEKIQNRALRRFDAVVSVSRPLTAHLAGRGIPAARLHTIPNALPSTGDVLPADEAVRTLGLAGSGPRVGWVGRLSPEKGPDVFIRAMAGVDGDVRGIVIGEGPMAASLGSLTTSLGVEQRVRFIPGVPSAGRILRAFDVVVLSSWTEGTPMVLLEAMAARVPVVTTAVGGVPDVVGPEEALLVPAGDERALAAAIEETLREPARAGERAARASRRLAERFAVEPWVHAYQNVYAALLAARP